MNQTKIIIIGGGLSGLYAAYLLEQAGMTDYRVLEARDRLGGRILSKQGFDLGATWIWSELNPELMNLIHALKLEYFEQFETGNLLVEQQRDHVSMHTGNTFRSAPSIRLQGGMQSLIDALRLFIPTQRILQDQQVTDLQYHANDGVQITAKNSSGNSTRYMSDYVLLALPPRLAIQDLAFKPSLPLAFQTRCSNVATWMAPHAKYIAIYPEAFWKQQGLSGQAFSRVGPMSEIHDASHPDRPAALFGFLNLPYSVRMQMDEEILLTHCRAQLVRIFGSLATNPEVEFLQDWSAEPYTSTESDWKNPTQFHGLAPSITPQDNIWQNRIFGISSEWSKAYSGYLAGAIDAATAGVNQILALDQFSNHTFIKETYSENNL